MLGLRGLTSDPPKKKRKRERQPSANDPFFLFFLKKNWVDETSSIQIF
jgi:hypothetical protein